MNSVHEWLWALSMGAGAAFIPWTSDSAAAAQQKQAAQTGSQQGLRAQGAARFRIPIRNAARLPAYFTIFSSFTNMLAHARSISSGVI